MNVKLFRRDGSEIGTGESVREIVEENRADLVNANLRSANLRSANLGGANLVGADLGNTDLVYADLVNADLGGADLVGANLRNADLVGADLVGADLVYADLVSANLRGADLVGANLRSANLRNANLVNANLRSANLRNANLVNANLRSANLGNKKADLQALHDHVSILPDGVLVGWKKAHAEESPVIVQLRIPADARRSNATGRKCRCDRATVMDMHLLDGTLFEGEAASQHDPDFKYRVGDVISVPDFDDDVWNECAPGIHFFITETEAREY